MRSTGRAAALVAATALGLLIAFAVVWRGTSAFHIGRSDFTSTYVGATLLRDGDGGRLYDESVQAPVHARLIAPDTEGNLPYVNPPAAAVVALPVTLTDLHTAYWVWSALQFLLLVAAVVIAGRAAPWPPGTPPRTRVATGLVALAGAGTLNLVLLGQWDGVSALGVACAYSSWRRGRMLSGGAWLGATAALAKPHLAFGLAAFALARRDRRLLAGAAAGVLAVVAVSLVAVGPSGVAGFVRLTADTTTRWHLAEMMGFTGLFGSWLGDGATTQAVAAGCSVAAVATCAVLGDIWQREDRRLDVALAGAVALSLVASPHLLGHDLSLLAPVAVWIVAVATASDRAAAWPGRMARSAVLAWVVLNAAAFAELGRTAPAPPGRITPMVLAALGVIAAWTCLRGRRRAALREPTRAYSTGRGAGGVVE